MPPTRIAVVGAGYWGSAHVRTVVANSRAHLSLVCDRSPESLGRIEHLAGGARLTTRLEDVLAARDIDGVIVATPSTTHAEIACRLLEEGHHVLVEKPLATNVTDAIAVTRAAERKGAVLLVGHLMLYHPAVEFLRAVIDSGELGDLYYLASTRVNLGRLRSDENALWSLGPHDISMLDFLIDAPAASITAVGQSFLQPGIHDVVFVTMSFERPISPAPMAHVHLSWLNPRKERRLVVVGSRKMVEFDDVAHDKLHVHDRGYERPPEFSSFAEYLTLRDGPVTIPHVPMVEPLAAMIDHFIDCMSTGARPRTDGASGVRVVRTLEAAQSKLLAEPGR
jgi:predicted dehydrogenase